MDRREFLLRATRTGLSAGLAASPFAGLARRARAEQQRPGRLKKAVTLGMLPGSLPLADRFKLARDCGFDGIEAPPVNGPAELDELRHAVEASAIPVHSIIYGGWRKPLSHPDPAVADAGMEEVRAALECAAAVGADGVLLVPAVVNKETRYQHAWERSQERIRKLIPAARELKVRILVEVVWNKFLLSPLEFARYIDEFKSPWVQAYFDVGNVIDFGWPEDWVRTLGRRIAKVHLKDFRREGRQWVNLGEGDADYPAVMQALREVSYSGWLTCELPGGDEAYLRDLGKRVNRIIHGQPVQG